MSEKFTIIIPIFNEEDSIFNLISEIIEEFENFELEILIINDGSTDNFNNKFKKYSVPKIEVKVIQHSTNQGKCKSMLTGVKNAKYQNICVIDGDGQNPPSEIKKMLAVWDTKNKNEKKFLLLCGHRVKRMDNIKKKVSSLIANKIRKIILNDDCNDTACALKFFKKNDYVKIPYFKNVHRFLPALFKAHGGQIINIAVEDRPRISGISKYNFNNRFWVGIRDLYKVWRLINIEKEEI